MILKCSFSLVSKRRHIRGQCAVHYLGFCREGILFSINPRENPDFAGGPPPNISFLEILIEFSSKLMKQDKKVV